MYDTALEAVPTEYIGANTPWNLYLPPVDANGAQIPRPTAQHRGDTALM